MTDRSVLTALLVAPAAALGLFEASVAVGRWDAASVLATVAVASGALVAVAPRPWTARLLIVPGLLAALTAGMLGAFAPPYPGALAAVAVGTVAGGPVVLGGLAMGYRRRPAPLLLVSGALLAADAVVLALVRASPGPGSVGLAGALERILVAQADGLGQLFGHGAVPSALPLASPASVEYAVVALLAVFALLWSLLAPGGESGAGTGAPRPFWGWWAPSAGAAATAAGTVALASLPVNRFVAWTAIVAAALLGVLAFAMARSGTRRTG